MAVRAMVPKRGACLECHPSVLCDVCMSFSCGDASFFFRASVPPREPARRRRAVSMDSGPSSGPPDKRHHHGILLGSPFARAHCFSWSPFLAPFFPTSWRPFPCAPRPAVSDRWSMSAGGSESGSQTSFSSQESLEGCRLLARFSLLFVCCCCLLDASHSHVLRLQRVSRPM